MMLCDGCTLGAETHDQAVTVRVRYWSFLQRRTCADACVFQAQHSFDLVDVGQVVTKVEEVAALSEFGSSEGLAQCSSACIHAGQYPSG